MKLYIPEIGDQLVLTEDWTFDLHYERRNIPLVTLLGYYYTFCGWVSEKDLVPMNDADYAIDWKKSTKQLEASCPEYARYWEDYSVWSKACEKLAKDSIKITLPAGTVLGVDRIYIRKGISDYSSITFFAKGLGETLISNRGKTKKVKAHRFWAKLADCNNITFEKQG